MTELMISMAKYGWAPVLVGVVIYIVLNSNVDIHYPRK